MTRAQYYIDCTIADYALLLWYHKLLVSCASPYLVAIIMQSKVFGSYVGWPIRLQEQVLVVNQPFDHEHQIENISLLALPPVMNSSNLLEAGPRGISTV